MYISGMLSHWIIIGVMVFTVVSRVIVMEFLGNFSSIVPTSSQLGLLSIVIGFVSMPIAVVLKCIMLKERLVSTMPVMTSYQTVQKLFDIGNKEETLGLPELKNRCLEWWTGDLSILRIKNMTSVVGRVISPPDLKLSTPAGKMQVIKVDKEKCELYEW